MNKLYKDRMKRIEREINILKEKIATNIIMGCDITEDSIIAIESAIHTIQKELIYNELRIEEDESKDLQELLKRCKYVVGRVMSTRSDIDLTQDVKDDIRSMAYLTNKITFDSISIGNILDSLVVDIAKIKDYDMRLECVKIIGPILYEESTNSDGVVNLKYYMNTDTCNTPIEKTLILLMYHTNKTSS